MTPLGYASAIIFVVLMVISWIYYLRHDIVRRFKEIGPRRQMEREEREARQQELDRLRDELAAKYLDSSEPKLPGTGAP